VFWERCKFPVRLRNDLYCVEWGVKLYSLTVSARGRVGRGVEAKPELNSVHRCLKIWQHADGRCCWELTDYKRHKNAAMNT